MQMYVPTRLLAALLALPLLLALETTALAGSPYVGMQPQELPKNAAKALGFSGSDGVVAIRDVGRDTPAGRAGIQRGDVLLSMNGEDVQTLAQVIAIVTEASPGDVFELTMLRNGEKIDVSLKTTEWPEQRIIKKNYIGQIPALGVTTGALTKKIRDQFSIRWDSEGVLVTLVDPSKGVSEVIKRGDVIVQFNQQPVWLPEHLIEAYTKAKAAKKKAALVLLERPEGYVFITLPVK